jgi:hypothetical protein
MPIKPFIYKSENKIEPKRLVKLIENYQRNFGIGQRKIFCQIAVNKQSDVTAREK